MSACLNQFGLADINCTAMIDDNIAVAYNDLVNNLAINFEYNPWIFAAIGSILIGLSGIFPLLIISVDDGLNVKNGAGGDRLKVLLSFAVGGLLGDVFLHLLPEAWANDAKYNNNNNTSKHGHPPCLFSGMMLLAGMLLFIVIEKLFAGINEDQLEQHDNNNEKKLNNNITKKYKFIDNNGNGLSLIKHGLQKRIKQNDFIRQMNCNHTKLITDDDDNNLFLKKRSVSGYLNLMANSIDNFTHGLAVGGSFLISMRLGMFTTVAILIHEIPHEIGDFAILLKSGFSKWEAARGQLITASGGIIGALTAVASSGANSSVDGQTSWILPFTAGGFLHIALVSVLPDLLKEDNSRESMKQFCALIFGIIVMAGMTLIE